MEQPPRGGNTTAGGVGRAPRLLRSRGFLAVNIAALAALIIAIVVYAVSTLHLTLAPPAQPAITITGPDDGATTSVTAYILGDVSAPGVYTLASGARVQALVAAAGGALDDADLTRVDLAALVLDGQEIYVPRVGETIPFMLGGKVNINVASADDLHNALGVSRAIATRIVAYRVAHGAFTAVSQLLLVPISRAEFDKVKLLVTV
jgi:competence protein ComEA